MAASTFPLIFTFREVVVGKGYAAGVLLQGRALLTYEAEDDVWLYGVQPGGIAGGGKTYVEACAQFRQGCKAVLIDMVTEAATYEGFVDEVRVFFDQICDPNVPLWDQALADVRASGHSGASLPSVRSESRPPRLEITNLEGAQLRPQANALDYVAEAA